MRSHGTLWISRAINGWILNGPDGGKKRVFLNLGDLTKFLHDWVHGDDDTVVDDGPMGEIVLKTRT